MTKKTLSRISVLVVEDDELFRHLMCETLDDLGCEAVGCSTVQEAFAAARREKFALFIVDAMLPNSPDATGIGSVEARGGLQTGVALLRRLGTEFKGIPAIVMTGYPNAEVQLWCRESGVVYMLKPIERSVLRQTLEELTGSKGRKRKPIVFIVHGQDQTALDELTSMLKVKFAVEKPIILRDQPGKGRTLIESLESFQHMVDIVFVLLTPDDKLCASGDSDDVKRCARQNVIFELGLFYGYLGRLSGRVVLLHRGGIDLPSDIQGIKWVDISKGVQSAESDIRSGLSGRL